MVDWDARYEGEEFFFGTEPAAFLLSHAAVMAAGSKVLCVADGEGRNSVALAGLGHEVTAFDQSAVAVEKARAFAVRSGQSVDYHVSGIDDWDWSRQFDVVVAIFIQFASPDRRVRLFDELARAVRPGGMLLLHGYAPRQVDNGTGGPPQRAHMYTTDMLAAAFAGWDFLTLEDYDAVIEEGSGHSGHSALVDLVARKPGL